MIFNFDGGDILVILIVGLLLFLFRRFDRTGRSLEKVRRYADKSKGELDAIVHERKLGLKDLSVDLEVQEKTNREILARADAARGEILSKTEDLEARVEKIEAHEKALEDLNIMALRVDENLARLKDESKYVDGVGRRLSEIQEKFTGMADLDSRRFDAFREDALGFFRDEIQSLKLNLDEIGRQVEFSHETIASLNARRDEEVSGKLAAFRDELELIEENFNTRLLQVAEGGERLEHQAFTALNEKIAAQTQHLESNWKGGMNQLKDHVGSNVGEVRDRIAEIRQVMETVNGDFQALEERLSTKSQGITQHLEQLDQRFQTDTGEIADRMEHGIKSLNGNLNEGLSELSSRIDHRVKNNETAMLEAIETQQNEYRKTVEDRFERIDEFTQDMDRLTESLRLSQQQTVQEVEQVFQSFDAEMEERRDLERARLKEKSAALQQDMTDLEQGLDELKSRAYDNVSEQLQVFEDEFFADLKNRDSQMRATLEEWRKNVDLELVELEQKANRDREENERRHTVEMKQKLTDLQSRTYSQFESFQDQMDGFRNSLSSRIHAAEGELTEFRKSLSDRIEKEKTASNEEFNKAFENFDKTTADKIAKSEKAVSRQLANFSQEVDSRSKEWMNEFQAARSEVLEWKERLSLQVEETTRSAQDSVDSLRTELTSRMVELQDEYSGRTEQLILESGEGRAALRREIAILEESISHLSLELTEKTRDSMDTLKDQSETFLLEFRKNSRDARDEMERKVKDLRRSVQESRERSEANRKEMVAHTDTEYARLMRNLDEIDKRQREFIAETRVFDRADQMKEGLEADITELKRQLETVGAGREEIRGINEQYGRAISLYDEVREKLNKFLSEQQKVEILEDKIARIGNLSESVELKLSRVSDADDTLQGLQIRLKQLEDLHEDLGERYAGLVNKTALLDSATEGMEKNFERMERIEKALKGLSNEIDPLREELDAAEKRQFRLEESRQTINTMAEKVAAIDSTLAELDERLESLNTAREWLARTETRLEEINTDMQQRVRLVETLSKREGGRRSSGSPDMSTREVVVKLAREGWNSDEIARTTKLSRGEVELILELTPHS